ncbi:S8 family serine peptidase [Deinococcus sp. SDU3-2]|uniref:S8 family serine peptidase n=1 Tax=Deinococcus terrestris TaxID=2651870 RepID=A0A7X1NVM4_9DEIO|nr:S8 family serine peptidase [Deinococcus terrestris]MPY66652.1 S8 family serine peptidase [Deinococcus terrestris]
MNTPRTTLLLTAAILLAGCGSQNARQPSTPAPSQSGTAIRVPVSEISSTTGRYFVELEGDPTVLGAQSLQGQQASFRAQVARAGIRWQEHSSYQRLFNGFSVSVTPAEAARISRMPGVLSVFPVLEIERPQAMLEQGASETQVQTAAGLTGATYVREELGLTGKGVKVAVMDTGIDLEHPAFRNRVVAGYDFVGDAFGSNGNTTPVPDNNPDDCGGHGTHVAGIVGANDPTNGFLGVAPDVQFGAYKVFGCEGSTNADIMLQAMERADADDMDVLNMSIGAAFQWPSYPTAKAASRLAKRGMIVTVSAGNSGTSGQYATGAPSLGENVISVASIDNTKLELGVLVLAADGSRLGYAVATGAPDPETGLSLPLAKAPGSTPTTANDGCSVNGVSPYAPNSLEGKAVLIRRGTCSFREKALNAQAAGAKAVLIYNNAPGVVSATVAPSLASDNVVIEIPVVGLTPEDGARLDAAIGSTVTFTGDTQLFPNITGNTLSSFSSYGPSPDLDLKPDVSAPGGLIKSTYPLTQEATGYAVLSGTSMAAPHAAGIAALLLEKHPQLASIDGNARRLFQNTAVPGNYFLNGSISPFVDFVQRQGAGLMNAPAALAALESGVSVTPSKIALGESEAFPTRTKVLTLRNNGAVRQIYQVYHVPALAISASTFAPQPLTVAATVSVNGESAEIAEGGINVSVAPYSSVELEVTITAPTAPVRGQYGGHIVMQGVTGVDLSVPYGGLIGDYQSIQVLGNISLPGYGLGTTPRNFPALFDGVEGQIYFEGATPTEKPVFTLGQVNVAEEGEEAAFVLDIPRLWVHLAHQSRWIEMDVLDANGNLLDTVSRDEYVGRNASNSYTGPTSNAYYTWSWDGTLANGNAAPNGDYRLRLRVLKALGDENNPDHIETYTSPVFGIQRP